MKHYAYESPFKMVDEDGKEYLLTVERDDYAEDPRYWDNLCTMVCWHSRYSLGDKHGFHSVLEFMLDLYREVVGESWFKKHENDDWQDVYKALQDTDLVLIKAINLYDHSGITISTSDGYPYNDRWDSSVVGFIYISKKTLLDNGVVSLPNEEKWKEVADTYIEDEMQTYDQYLRGECYRFTLEEKVHYRNETTCPHCGEVIKVDEYDTYEEVDSCCGFYGDCLEENGMLDYLDVEFAEED
jgi:hypothetical protein